MKKNYQNIFTILISIMFLLLHNQSIKAQKIKLAWHLNQENYIKHYNIYRDTSCNPKTLIAKVMANDTTFYDSNIKSGIKYFYRITAEDSFGNISGFSNEVYGKAPRYIIDTKSNHGNLISKNFKLLQNYPNPFSISSKSITTIKYFLNKESYHTLIIYDITGKEVKKLIIDKKAAGAHQINWNGIDNYGNRVSSGIYFYKLKTDNYVLSKKIILMK